MAYARPAAAVDGTTVYNAARDNVMNAGIEAAATVADAAQAGLATKANVADLPGIYGPGGTAGNLGTEEVIALIVALGG